MGNCNVCCLDAQNRKNTQKDTIQQDYLKLLIENSHARQTETKDPNCIAKVNKYDPEAFKFRSVRESLKLKERLLHDTSDITKDTPEKYNSSSIRQSLMLSPTNKQLLRRSISNLDQASTALLDMKHQTKNQDLESENESEYTITSIKRVATQGGKNVIYQESDGGSIIDDNQSSNTQVIVLERNFNSSNSNISSNMQRRGKLNSNYFGKSRMPPQSIMSSTSIKKIQTMDSDLQSNTSIERMDSLRSNYIHQRSNLTSGRQQTNELQSNISYTQSGGTMIKHISGSNSNSQLNSKNEQNKEIYDGRSYILSEQDGEDEDWTQDFNQSSMIFLSQTQRSNWKQINNTFEDTQQKNDLQILLNDIKL